MCNLILVMLDFYPKRLLRTMNLSSYQKVSDFTQPYVILRLFMCYLYYFIHKETK